MSLIKLIKMANQLDEEGLYKLADKMEKLAANQMNNMMQSNDLMQSSATTPSMPTPASSTNYPVSSDTTLNNLSLQQLQQLLQNYDQQLNTAKQQLQSTPPTSFLNKMMGVQDTDQVLATAKVNALQGYRDNIATKITEYQSNAGRGRQFDPQSYWYNDGKQYWTRDNQWYAYQPNQIKQDAYGQQWGWVNDTTNINGQTSSGPRYVVLNSGALPIKFTDKTGYPTEIDAYKGASASPMGFALSPDLYDKVQAGDPAAMQQAQALAQQHIDKIANPNTNWDMGRNPFKK